MNLRLRLDDFAERIIGRALEADTAFGMQLDAFKAVSAYYTALNKTKGAPDTPPDAPKFSDLAKTLAELDDAQ